MKLIVVGCATVSAVLIGVFAATPPARQGASNPLVEPPRQGMATDINHLLQELQFDDPGQPGSSNRRFAAYKEISQTQRGLADRLIEIVKSDNEDRGFSGSRALAAKLLGEMSGKRRVITALVGNIDYREQSFVESNFSPFNGYPCALALVDIGQSSVPVIFEHLRAYRRYTPGEVVARSQQRLPVPAPVSDKAIELYAWVMFSVYQEEGDWPQAIGLMESAVRRSDYKDDMERLLEKMKEITKNWAPPVRP